MRRRHVEIAGKRRSMRGWHPDLPDHRDAAYRVEELSGLPKAASLRQWRSRIEDQGPEGSCTANAWTSACELLRKKGGLPEEQLARQPFYFTTRVLVAGGDPADDSGARVRDCAKAAVRYGFGREDDYPYVPGAIADPPPEAYWPDAATRKLERYNTAPTLQAIRTMVAMGFPTVFGFSVPATLEASDFDGRLAVPGPDVAMLGGHCTYVDGYDDELEIPGEAEPGALKVVNSWGEGFGLRDDPGCFWLAYRWVSSGLARDFTAPRLVGLAP